MWDIKKKSERYIQYTDMPEKVRSLNLSYMSYYSVTQCFCHCHHHSGNAVNVTLQLQETVEGSSQAWDSEVWCSVVHLLISVKTRNPGSHGFPADTHWWMCHGNRTRGLHPISFLQSRAGECWEDIIIVIIIISFQTKPKRFCQMEETCAICSRLSQSLAKIAPFPM